VTVKAPARADTEAAFEVFSEATLPGCIGAVPQALVACLVKTLGSAGQAPVMRAAAARCLSHLVACLARGPGGGGGGAAGPAAAVAAGAVTLEGICREPDLMGNLYKCLKAGNDGAIGIAPPQPQAGPAAAQLPAGGGGADGAAAAEMAEAAARCVAALLTVRPGRGPQPGAGRAPANLPRMRQPLSSHLSST
jgi:hypothetical protein